jgi:hypothetical protein
LLVKKGTQAGEDEAREVDVGEEILLAEFAGAELAGDGFAENGQVAGDVRVGPGGAEAGVAVASGDEFVTVAVAGGEAEIGDIGVHAGDAKLGAGFRALAGEEFKKRTGELVGAGDPGRRSALEDKSSQCNSDAAQRHRRIMAWRAG